MPGRRYDAYSHEEVALIRSMAGAHPPDVIARTLTERFGHKRTTEAIRKFAQLQCIAMGSSGYSARQVAQIFGVAKPTISRWIDLGWLPAERWQTHKWRITAEQINAFIELYPWMPQLGLMQPGPFRTLAEVVQKREPWFTTKEVVRLTGIRLGTLRLWIREGLITARWGMLQGAQNAYFVPASELPHIKALIAERKQRIRDWQEEFGKRYGGTQLSAEDWERIRAQRALNRHWRNRAA